MSLFNDAYQHEKRIAADKFERNPVGTLRACLTGDPVAFSGLVLIAVGPLRARQIGDRPTDGELEWIARELLAALRGEESDGERHSGRLN
jgi:hypothetical protein